MKQSKKIHHFLSDVEFSELRAGAEEALAHVQGKKVTLRYAFRSPAAEALGIYS